MTTFSNILLDALDDWKEYVHIRRARNMWVGGDEDLSFALVHLKEICCVNFNSFLPDEVLVFMLKTYPRSDLFNLGKRQSAFLHKLYEYWDPELRVWAAVLWRFCGKSCNLFAQVISVNTGVRAATPMPDGTMLPARDEGHFGQALFLDLLRTQFKGQQMTEGTLQSVIGALVRFPLLDSLARMHEEDIAQYTKYFTPIQVGQVCQRLLMFRARPKDCMCGWMAGEAECRCELQLEFDPSKEYAFVLFRLISERHSGENDFQQPFGSNSMQALPPPWTSAHTAQFLHVACDHVFSAGVYKEVYENLQLNKTHNPQEPPLANPRRLTDKEKHANYARHMDNDYSSDVSKHGGCVLRNCKQIAKKDCYNVSCKSHCSKFGMLKCRSHHTPGRGLPTLDLSTPSRSEARGAASSAAGNSRYH